MKTKLLALALCLFTLVSFSQTNGWHQYHKATQISNLDTDASGNIHLATDSGYIMYNTTTSMVEDYANLTSQSLPIGRCSSIKVNPINNNVALGFPGGQGMAIYDGANYTIYHSDSSDYGDFSNPEFHYTDGGLLYIYDTGDTKYQTFENGVFGVVQDLTFRPQAIIENSAGTIAYFAGQTPGGLADGLYELDKATDTFTKYTTSNSGIHSNGPSCFYRDTNDLLYIGGHMGVSTLDTMGNWTVYQEPLPINPSLFYSVYSIDKFSDGTFLVNNSDPNSSSQRGFSTVDFSTNTWTHYDSSVYCNNADNVGNMVLVNDLVYTHFRNFSLPSDDYKLWSFDTSNNTCEEQDINHLNVADLGLYGTTGLAIRENSMNTDAIQVLWTNNGGKELKNITLPTSFSGGFPNVNNLLTSTVALNDINPITIDDEPILLVGDDDGVWFIDASNSSTHIPHGLDFRMTTLDITFSLNNGAKSLGLIGGWNNTTFEYEVRIIEANGAITTNRDFDNGSIDLSESIDFGVEFSGLVNTGCIEDENGNLNCTASGQTNTGEIHIVNFVYTPETNRINREVSLPGPTIGQSANISGSVNFPPDIYYINRDDGRRNPCFNKSNRDIDCVTPTDSGLTFATHRVDINDDGEADPVIQSKISFPPSLAESLTSIFFSESTPNSTTSRLSEYIKLIVSADQVINTNSIGTNNNEEENNNPEELIIDVVPNTFLENLPEDFFVLSSYIYIYSGTHFATVMSTTRGLLINTAIDYSSLTLSNNEEVLNDNDLVMYPNPTTDMVFITTAENLKNIEVLDMNGRHVLSPSTNAFSVKGLARGVYIVKAINENNIVFSRKLIKD